MKTVVITGASRGIGRALAEKFLQNDDFVIGTSTSGEISIDHENLLKLRLDLSKEESINECVRKIEESGKRIDILINNAGIWSGAEVDERIFADKIRRTFEVNTIGPAVLTEKLSPLLNKGAHVVNISSRAGSMETTYHANYPDYKISKAALNMVTRVFAHKLKGKAVVSSVHPGWVKTDMGGSDADVSPQEAAEHIFKLANSEVETGQFWFEGKKYPW